MLSPFACCLFAQSHSSLSRSNMDHRDKRPRIEAIGAAAPHPTDPAAAAAGASLPVVHDYFPQYSADSLKAGLKGTIELEKKLTNKTGTTDHEVNQITNQAMNHRELLIQSHLDWMLKWGFDREQAIQIKHKQAAEEAKRESDAMMKEQLEQGDEINELKRKAEKAEEKHNDQCKRLTYEILEGKHKLEKMEPEHKEEHHRLTRGIDVERKKLATQVNQHNLLQVTYRNLSDKMDTKEKRTICKDRPRDCVFDECGHFASCMQCAEGLKTCSCCQVHISKKKRKVFCS